MTLPFTERIYFAGKHQKPIFLTVSFEVLIRHSIGNSFFFFFELVEDQGQQIHMWEHLHMGGIQRHRSSFDHIGREYT